VLLHHQKKFDNDFGGWPNHDLALPPFLSIVHALESIVQHTNPHHSRSLTSKYQLESINETTQSNGISSKKQKNDLNLTKKKKRESSGTCVGAFFSSANEQQRRKHANKNTRV